MSNKICIVFKFENILKMAEKIIMCKYISYRYNNTLILTKGLFGIVICPSLLNLKYSSLIHFVTTYNSNIFY